MDIKYLEENFLFTDVLDGFDMSESSFDVLDLVNVREGEFDHIWETFFVLASSFWEEPDEFVMSSVFF